MEGICSHESDEEDFEDVAYDGVTMCEEDCLDDHTNDKYEDEV